MVNVFIIHSGKDFNYVKETLEPFLKGEKDINNNDIKSPNNSNILTLESGSKSSWKIEAKKKIKMSQVVIVLLGEDSNLETKVKTMGYEVKIAVKYNKQIMILNPLNVKLPSFLYRVDKFTKLDQPISKEETLASIKKRIDDYSNGYYDIFSKNIVKEEDRDKYNNDLIEQYKIFQKTSEDLVARRQNVNSFYITVNSAIVAVTGLVIGLVDMPIKLYVAIAMCILGFILDLSWIKILDAYGTLNSAKMKVISLMEKNLPVAAYDVEWKVMSDKLNNKKYVSFTNSEKRIPIIFFAIYMICCIVLVVLLIKFYCFDVNVGGNDVNPVSNSIIYNHIFTNLIFNFK